MTHKFDLKFKFKVTATWHALISTTLNGLFWTIFLKRYFSGNFKMIQLVF